MENLNFLRIVNSNSQLYRIKCILTEMTIRSWTFVGEQERYVAVSFDNDNEFDYSDKSNKVVFVVKPLNRIVIVRLP